MGSDTLTPKYYELMLANIPLDLSALEWSWSLYPTRWHASLYMSYDANISFTIRPYPKTYALYYSIRFTDHEHEISPRRFKNIKDAKRAAALIAYYFLANRLNRHIGKLNLDLKEKDRVLNKFNLLSGQNSNPTE